MPAEPFRPAYHFAPARNWMNDPNGLVWYDGEYHLFFQYNPLGCDWGNMSWGHAVSPDLVHWEELPVALEATEDEHVFSGSVVVDRANTSGLGSEGTPAMVALYTSHAVGSGVQTQAVASSVDRGRTWTRYPGNPVLDIGSPDFRDPKVFWYDDGGFWVMVVVRAADRVVAFYRSDDLLRWEHLSDFGPRGSVDHVWECPDLFPLPVDGDPTSRRWVLVVSVQAGAPAGGSGMQYFVGDFDGAAFTAELPADPAEVAWLDHGADFYAAVSFTDAPDGGRLLVGWMSNWAYAKGLPTVAFRGAMSLPRRFELRTVGGGLRLVQRPVAPPPRRSLLRAESLAVEEGIHPLRECDGAALVVSAEFEVGSAGRFGLLVRTGGHERTVVGYDVGLGCVYVDRSRSGTSTFDPSFAAVHRADLEPSGGVVRLEVYVDTASVEVFAGEGEVVITDQVFPAADSVGTAVFAEGGAVHLRRLTVDAAMPPAGGPPPVAGVVAPAVTR